MRAVPLAECVRLLHRYRVPFADYRIVRTKEEAVRAAREIGYPVVMKYLSADILHKTEKGVVKTALDDDWAVRDAWNEIQRNAGKARFDGMMVQKQIDGVELIVGGKMDPQFGPIVLFGLGGIFVEIIRDFSVRVAPVSKRQALEMIREIRGYPVLAGARGRPPIAIDELARVIVAVSRLHVDYPEIVELDINPLFANPKGCIAADVRMLRV